MMRSAVIAIFLILVGCISGILNASGIIPVALPDDQFTMLDQSIITDMTEGISDGEFNLLGALSSIGTFAKIIFQGIITGITFAPLLISYGVPWWIAWPLNTPVWFVYGLDILNWYGNRPPN